MKTFKPQYNSIYQALCRLYYNSKTSANTRKSKGRFEAGEHNITVKDLIKVWNEQNGNCYYSGIPMNYNKSEWRVSIERLDNTKGYINGNVVLCCLEFNTRCQWSSSKIDNMLEILEKNIEKVTEEFSFVKRKHYVKYYEQVTPQGVTMYNCTTCNTLKTQEHFYTGYKYIGCKNCFKNKMHNKTPRQTMQVLLASAATAAMYRKSKDKYPQRAECTITLHDLITLYNQQNGLCAYSGMPLQFGSYRYKSWVISLERIDTTKGYTNNNICLICAEFNSSDQSVKTGPEHGSAGWTTLKFQCFLAYIHHKKGLISDEELYTIKDLQIQYSARSHSRNTRYITARVVSILSQAKRDYGCIYSITSPSGKMYIESTHVLFQLKSNMFAKIRKYKYKYILNEIAKYGEEAMIVETLVACKKDRLEEFKEYFIQTYNTRRPHGLNAKVIVSKETKEKITKALIEKNVRYGHTQQELPMYVKYHNWADRKGYSIASHPKCKKKDFVSKKKSLEELYQECIAYLDTLK